jgi:integrase
LFTPTGQPALGDLPVKSVTPDMIELFFTGLRLAGKAAGTRNKYRQTALSLFKWAVKHRYLDRLPVDADDDESEIAHVSERDARRHRRLKPGEEDALLKHANASLQRLIIGALETAMRLGELLNLRWADVDLARRVIHVRPETNKTRKYRAVPISERLLPFLTMARTDLTGKDRPLTDHVFSDDTGRKVSCIKKGWNTCVLKAHGQTLTWRATGALSAETRAALAAIDLHFHDLRHEAGSRRAEEGWELHKVRDVLGHASLEQTSTYLNTSTEGLLESQRRSDEKRRGETHSVASALQSEATQSIAISATANTTSSGKSLVN